MTFNKIVALLSVKNAKIRENLQDFQEDVSAEEGETVGFFGNMKGVLIVIAVLGVTLGILKALFPQVINELIDMIFSTFGRTNHNVQEVTDVGW